jgi:hypothetical protein
MKQFEMTDRKEPSPKKPGQKSHPSESAFDKWLNRGLHELFDDVMKEAVPPEMMKLLKPENPDGNETKDKSGDGKAKKKEGDIKK